MRTKITTLLITIFYIMNVQGLRAQNFTLYGDKALGGNKSESYCQVLKFSESKLVMAGMSQTIIPFGDKTDPSCNLVANNNNDIWMVMVDTSFNILWNVSLGGEGAERGVTSLVKTMNNEIVFSTASSSDSSCEKSENAKGQDDYWICKVDSNGNKLWDKTFGSPGLDIFPTLIQLSTGDFVVGGRSGGGIGADKTVANYGDYDFWVVKFDTLGNKLWDNVYGGSGTELTASNAGNMGQNLLCPDADGSFVLTGRTNSPVSGNVSSAGNGDWDIWIIKVDSTGNKIWDKRYGGVGSVDYVAQCIKTKDGYLLLGLISGSQGGDISDPPIGSYDIWLLKLDTLGNKLWDKRYGGTDNNRPVSISEAPGGGYWICANTNSPAGFDVTEPAYGINDYWMLKIDSAGTKLWDKRFGGPTSSIASSCVLMADSSIFVCGYAFSGSNAIKTDSGNGESDFWMVHFIDKNTSVGIHPIALSSNIAAVFPNPAKDFFTVDFSLPTPEKSVFSLYNFLGEKLLSENINKNEKHLKVTTQGYSEGVYFWKLTSASQSQSGKIVLIK